MNIVSLIKDYIIFKPKTKEELQEAVNLWCLKNSFHEEVPNIYRKITLSDTSLKKLNRYGNISLWDTSLITDMSYLFGFTKGYLYNKDNFNENDYEEYLNALSLNFKKHFNDDISNWNVSSVTNMSYMFYQAELFNQPLDSWNVSSVINMECMFCVASSFNQSVNSWDISSVTNMKWMLSGAKSFDKRNALWYDFQIKLY